MVKLLKTGLWLLMFHYLIFQVYGQKNTFLNLKISEELPKKIEKKCKPEYFKNIMDAKAAINELIQYCHISGYLSASVDSLVADSLEVRGLFFLGKRYELLRVLPNELNERVMREIGYNRNIFEREVIPFTEMAEMAEDIISFYENSGYPFTQCWLSDVVIDSNQIQANVNVERNERIIIDSIVVKGNARIAKGYLHQYLNIKPGQVYNESKIKRLAARLKELPMLTYSKPFDVLFSGDKSKIFLYLEKRKTSRFYGMLGILPNNQSSGKLLINGEVKLYLFNSFSRGELIDLNWRSISKNTQDLKLNFAYPYLFATNFGLSYGFTLFKKDTSYLTLNHDIGVQYYFSGTSYCKASVTLFKSNLLKAGGLESITVLPDFADVSSNIFGVNFFLERYNYRNNPTKGYLLSIYGGGGQKKIRKNNSINPILYDSILLKSTQIKLELNAEKYIPLFKKTTLLLKTQNAYLFDETFFANEMFKLGGLRSLRGFDDESILATGYSSLLFEFRYLFEKNSFLALFFNGAFYERHSQKGYINDVPYGFGAGLSFDTKIGTFSFYYALGSQFSQPISFKQGKIHFGFTNSF